MRVENLIEHNFFKFKLFNKLQDAKCRDIGDIFDLSNKKKLNSPQNYTDSKISRETNYKIQHNYFQLLLI